MLLAGNETGLTLAHKNRAGGLEWKNGAASHCARCPGSADHAAAIVGQAIVFLSEGQEKGFPQADVSAAMLIERQGERRVMHFLR
jgi:hypothetical protein